MTKSPSDLIAEIRDILYGVDFGLSGDGPDIFQKLNELESSLPVYIPELTGEDYKPQSRASVRVGNTSHMFEDEETRRRRGGN